MIENIICFVAKIALIVVVVYVIVRICKKAIRFILAVRDVIDEMLKKSTN